MNHRGRLPVELHPPQCLAETTLSAARPSLGTVVQPRAAARAGEATRGCGGTTAPTVPLAGGTNGVRGELLSRSFFFFFFFCRGRPDGSTARPVLATVVAPRPRRTAQGSCGAGAMGGGEEIVRIAKRLDKMVAKKTAVSDAATSLAGRPTA